MTSAKVGERDVVDAAAFRYLIARGKLTASLIQEAREFGKANARAKA